MNLLYNKNLYLYNKMIFDNQDFVVLVLFTKVHKYAEKYPKVHKLFVNTIARVKAKIAENRLQGVLEACIFIQCFQVGMIFGGWSYITLFTKRFDIYS